MRKQIRLLPNVKPRLMLNKRSLRNRNVNRRRKQIDWPKNKPSVRRKLAWLN